MERRPSFFFPSHPHCGIVLAMTVKTDKIEVRTRGDCHVVDITELAAGVVKRSGIRQGTVTLFNVGSTAGITTTEYEPGLAEHDLIEAFERIAPKSAHYEHEQTWHDDNGHSHVRASVVGPSLTVPIVDGGMPLGTWQQIVLIEFDTRPRTRTVLCQIMGE
jgi:secondary thiamine-phosphate synthase enzyme